MKKFSGLTDSKKNQSTATNKNSQHKNSTTLRAVAKKKAGKFMSIFNYEYQESDLEQFVI